MQQGLLLPRTQSKTFFATLKRIIKETSPKKIVINGDVKHAFGTILDEEWRDVLKLIDMIQEQDILLEVVLGNHDNFLKPVLQKRKIPSCKQLLIDDVLVTHGDTLPEQDLLKKTKTIIIGHEHPSVLLDDSVRKEKYKAFLKGKYKGKTIIVLPSSYPLVEGVDVLDQAPLGPLFKEASALVAFLLSEHEVLYFGPLKDLNKKA